MQLSIVRLGLHSETLLCVPHYFALTLRQLVLLNYTLYLNYLNDIARVETFVSVLIKIIISWNITPYRLVNASFAE